MREGYMFLFGIFLAFCSCKSDVSMHSDLVDIVSCDKFEDKSFTRVDQLNAVSFNDSVIQNLTRIALFDSLLFTIDSTVTSDTLVRCFSTVNKKYLGSVFLKGNAPTELLSASSISASVDSLSFWTFDMTKQLWTGMAFDKLSNRFLFQSAEDTDVLNLRNSNLPGLDNPVWIEGGFVISSLSKYIDRFFIYDSNAQLVKSVVNPDLIFKENYNEGILADILSTRMCVTPDRSKVILAGRYLDLIEIYDSKGNLQKMLKGPEKEFDLKFDTKRSIERSTLVKSEETKRAYLAVQATNNNIYALYSGKSKKDKEHYSYSKLLYVFSLDGNVMVKYTLDTPIISFAVDEKQKMIYAISIDAEVVSFDI